MSLRKMQVLGLSYSQTQSGAYALILVEKGGERRLPIIIGAAEAQSIAIQLEGLTPPRPLTHDLFLSLSEDFGITIEKVVIARLEAGIFYSQLFCKGNSALKIIDSRTSDAIALALRFRCPIYTTEEILQRASLVIDNPPEKDDDNAEDAEAKEKKRITQNQQKLALYSLDELNELLDEAVEEEDYEKASQIRDEIKKRNEQAD